MPLLTASNLGVSYSDLDVFSGISLEIAEGARTAIVGPNGGGKTSLLSVLVGEQEPDRGDVYRASGLRIGYVPQITQPITDGTVRDEVMVAFEELLSLENEVAESADAVQLAKDGARRTAERRYAALLSRYEDLGGYDYRSRMERVAAGVGLTERTLGSSIVSASGGERTRAALARALLAQPDLLVLDEPTNYLDFDGLKWLETFLGRWRHAFLVVSHDRFFLEAVPRQIWELDQGRLQTYRGNYSRYRTLRAERLARQTKQYERQQEFVAKEQAFIDRYRAGQRSKEARGRETRLARLERISEPHLREQALRMARTTVSRAPRVLVSARDLRVGVEADGTITELVSLPELTLDRGSRTAIIGHNGAGKTMLLQTILGERPPLSGSVTVAEGVNAGYQRQGSDDLPDGVTVLEAMQQVRNISPVEERTYLASFLFHGDDVFNDVSTLSGGERSRLAVARLMATEPNLLVLDEPTTHLDIPSREALEQALHDFPGSLLIVSHDRHLISSLARQLLVFEDATARLFAGTFDEWANQGSTSPVQTEPEAEPSPLRRRFGTPRKRSKGSRKPDSQPPPEPDHEQAVADLESRLAKLERDLQSASERQDVEEVVRLGEQYESVQAALKRAWDKWQRQSVS